VGTSKRIDQRTLTASGSAADASRQRNARRTVPGSAYNRLRVGAGIAAHAVRVAASVRWEQSRDGGEAVAPSRMRQSVDVGGGLSQLVQLDGFTIDQRCARDSAGTTAVA